MNTAWYTLHSSKPGVLQKYWQHSCLQSWQKANVYFYPRTVTQKTLKIQIIMTCWYCCYNCAGVLIPFKPLPWHMCEAHEGFTHTPGNWKLITPLHYIKTLKTVSYSILVITGKQKNNSFLVKRETYHLFFPHQWATDILALAMGVMYTLHE